MHIIKVFSLLATILGVVAVAASKPKTAQTDGAPYKFKGSRLPAPFRNGTNSWDCMSFTDEFYIDCNKIRLDYAQGIGPAEFQTLKGAEDEKHRPAPCDEWTQDYLDKEYGKDNSGLFKIGKLGFLNFVQDGMEIALPARTNLGRSKDTLFACDANTVYRDAKNPADPWKACTTKSL